ncbi:unnamed protein product [Didymodactylos carnosus]|uniref:Uncharacterized protein n=1 Tax=Didymodactylos carnosus TaxID=1234261 RepID=A0A815JL77_9BILA|nr:unnamed protein product [Didymodactylos carnosus]CAF4278923.1 unnamed protein product [Didymodactylos carnosus]
MHFFIVDLFKQLQKEYCKFKELNKYQRIIKLFRGQLMSKKEIESLKSDFYNQANKLIFANGFFSTTQNKKAAQFLAGTPTDSVNNDDQHVVLEIEVHVPSTKLPLANISHLSANEAEEEILVAPGALFLLRNVEYNEDDSVWYIKLTLINEDHERLINSQYKSVKMSNTVERQLVEVGHLLLKDTNDVNRLRTYYNLIQQHLCLSKDLYLVGLGWIAYENNNNPLALKLQHDALQAYQKNAQSNQQALIASIYQCVGTVHRRSKEYDLALQYFNLAIEQLSTDLLMDRFILIDCKINIACIIKLKGDFHLAWEKCKELAIMSSNQTGHFDFRHIYNKIASTDSNDNSRTDFDLDYCYNWEKFVDFCADNISGYYDIISNAYKKIANIYFYKKSDDLAVELLKKAVEVKMKYQPNDVYFIAFCINDIVKYYKNKKYYDMVVCFYQQLIEVNMKVSEEGEDSLCIIRTYIDIADTYHEKIELEHAVELYKAAIKLLVAKEKTSHLLISCYAKMADVYYEYGTLNLALNSYAKAIEMLESNRSDEMSTKKCCYEKMAIIHEKKGNSEQASVCRQKAIETTLSLDQFSTSFNVQTTEKKNSTTDTQSCLLIDNQQKANGKRERRCPIVDLLKQGYSF